MRQEIQASTRASITFGTPHHQLNILFNAYNEDLNYIEHCEQTPVAEPEMQSQDIYKIKQCRVHLAWDHS